MRKGFVLLAGTAVLLAPCAWDSSPHDAVAIARALSPFRQPAAVSADAETPRNPPARRCHGTIPTGTEAPLPWQTSSFSPRP